ncbi:unnamed protein product [Brassica rapa subsp. narinosa]|uniref:(rape) hypothetical protein n=1 Tax=Brassica napus TaxID=3708 RepID=A0A816X295_BRANA|nr:unnamed protein product [Brassica napus]
MFGYEEHPYGFYTLAGNTSSRFLPSSLRYGSQYPMILFYVAVLAIVLVGLLYGFFIAIICGQRINERHYHVLAKQELTKEYIVEDRDCKNVPDLDQSHVMELRMLGLY